MQPDATCVAPGNAEGKGRVWRVEGGEGCVEERDVLGMMCGDGLLDSGMDDDFVSVVVERTDVVAGDEVAEVEEGRVMLVTLVVAVEHVVVGACGRMPAVAGQMKNSSTSNSGMPEGTARELRTSNPIIP